MVLNFHGIGSAQRPVDKDEEPYWLSADRFHEILDLVDFYSHHIRIHITVDDGNRSDLGIVLPQMLARRRVAQFFVLAGNFGESGFLSRAEVRELSKAGMKIGTHGLSHTAWTTLSPTGLATEIDESIRRIEEASLTTVRAAAVPFGRYNRRVLQHLRIKGVDEVFTSDGGYTAPNDWLKPRTSLRSDTTGTEIEDLLAGKISLAHRLRQRARLWRKAYL